MQLVASVPHVGLVPGAAWWAKRSLAPAGAQFEFPKLWTSKLALPKLEIVQKNISMELNARQCPTL